MTMNGTCFSSGRSQGEAAGLLERECDIGFVELSRLACKDERCEITADDMITVLRNRRAYRRSSPASCSASCIRDYLALN